MAGAQDQFGFQRRGDMAGENVELLIGPVRIVGALQRQDGDGDGGKVTGDVERAEPRIEPGVVPAAKRDIGVGVIACEARAQIAGFVFGADGSMLAIFRSSTKKCAAIRTIPAMRGSDTAPA